MRVVFLEDVEGVAMGGDVKEVKNGFARNYLIPLGNFPSPGRQDLRGAGRRCHEHPVQRVTPGFLDTNCLT